MKTHVPSNKNGAILVIVMVVLVAFSLLTVALLQLGSFNQIETTRQLRMTQAHWLAEAGLERALSRVMGSKAYRDDLPDDFSDTTLLGGLGGYSVSITKAPDPTNSLLDTYTITSTGITSNNAMVVTNTVRLSLLGGPGGQQALLSLGGSSTISDLAANTTIDGTIYVEGTLNIANGKVTITDIVDANAISGNSGAATSGDLPEPNVIFNEAPYLAAVTDAGNSTNYVGTIQTSDLDFSVSTNNTILVNGSIEINSNIPAGKTIVASGNVENTSPHTTVGLGARIWSGGTVTFKNQVTLENRVEVFAQSDIVFDTSAAAGSPSSADGVTLLALHDIVTKNIDFNGIIYAEGRVNVTSGSDVDGTIIAGQGFDIAANVDVTYDPSVFAVPNPLNYGDGLAIQPDTWQWEEAPF